MLEQGPWNDFQTRRVTDVPTDGPWNDFQDNRQQEPKKKLPEEVPGLLSGEYSAPLSVGNEGVQSTIAPGESMPHALGRQAIGGVKNLVTGAVDLAKSMVPRNIPDALNLPLSMGKALLSPNVEEGKRAYSAVKRGDTDEAVRSGMATLIPGAGPMLRDAGDRAATGTIGPAVEQAAGYGIGKAVPPVYRGVKAGADKVTRPWTMRETKGYPKLVEQAGPKAARGAEQTFRASAPTEMNQGFRENVEVYAPRLAEIGRTLDLSGKRGGIGNPDMRFGAVEDAIRADLKNMYETQRKPQIDRQGHNFTQTEFGPDAVNGLEYLEKTAGKEGGSSLARQAIDVNIMSVAELDALARLVNKELVKFEGKNAAAQSLDEATVRKVGSLKQLGREVDGHIAKELEKAGEQGIRDYERVSAGGHDVADRIGRRDNSVTLLRRIPGIEHIRVFLGGKPSIASASAAAVASMNPGRILEKGLTNLARSPLKPATVPPRPANLTPASSLARANQLLRPRPRTGGFVESQRDSAPYSVDDTLAETLAKEPGRNRLNPRIPLDPDDITGHQPVDARAAMETEGRNRELRVRSGTELDRTRIPGMRIPEGGRTAAAKRVMDKAVSPRIPEETKGARIPMSEHTAPGWKPGPGVSAIEITARDIAERETALADLKAEPAPTMEMRAARGERIRELEAEVKTAKAEAEAAAERARQGILRGAGNRARAQRLASERRRVNLRP